LPVIESDNLVRGGSGEGKGVAARGCDRGKAYGLHWIVASLGVEATAKFVEGLKKPSGCTEIDVTLITD
jgi:hypothetical protein